MLAYSGQDGLENRYSGPPIASYRVRNTAFIIIISFKCTYLLNFNYMLTPMCLHEADASHIV